MFNIDKELSETQTAAAKRIFEMIKECAGEIFDCPPVFLESGNASVGIYPNYTEFKEACFVITANILFPNWQQLGKHGKAAKVLSQITGRSEQVIHTQLSHYKNIRDLRNVARKLQDDEPRRLREGLPLRHMELLGVSFNDKLLRTTNLVAHRLTAFAIAAPGF